MSSSRRPVAHQYLWSANSPYSILQHLIAWVWLILFFAVTFAVVRAVAPPWIHSGLSNSLTVPIHRNGPAPTIWSLGTLQHIFKHSSFHSLIFEHTAFISGSLRMQLVANFLSLPFGIKTTSSISWFWNYTLPIEFDPYLSTTHIWSCFWAFVKVKAGLARIHGRTGKGNALCWGQLMCFWLLSWKIFK